MKDMLGRLLKKIADLPNDILGVLCDLSDKLSGESSREWLTELKKFLRKEKCWVSQVVVWKTWKAIKIGTHRNIGALKADLKKVGREISDRANDVLNKVSLSDAEETVELVLVSVREIGFEKGATLKEIFDRALEMGLDLCPAEVGPQLALQYLDQPLGEWIRIAIESVAGSDGFLILFGVERDEGGLLWIYAYDGFPDFFWPPDGLFAFVRRK